MTSKQKSPAAGVVHAIADDLDRRLAPFAGKAKARKKTAGRAPDRGAIDAPLAEAAPALEDAQRVLRALAGQTSKLRETMAADLERLLAVAAAPGPPATDDGTAALKKQPESPPR
jgi:DNA-binding PucR family transcriptional regulator